MIAEPATEQFQGLPDEADNHLIELGVAARADAIVKRNLRDVSRGELKFPSLRVLTPEQCLEVSPIHLDDPFAR